MRLSTPARADEVATMCGSGCSASSEFTQTIDGACRVAQHRQEGAGRADHAEVLQVEFFAPGFVGGVGEGRHAALARVVHQHVGAAETRLHCLRECCDLVRVEHVAGSRRAIALRETAPSATLPLARAVRVAPADRDRCARSQKQFGSREADAGRAARHHRYLSGQVDLNHLSPSAFMYFVPASRYPSAGSSAAARVRRPRGAPCRSGRCRAATHRFRGAESSS